MIQKYVKGKMEKACQDGYRAAQGEAYAEIQQSRGLAIVMSGMEETYNRVRQQYRNFWRPVGLTAKAPLNLCFPPRMNRTPCNWGHSTICVSYVALSALTSQIPQG